MGDKQLKVNEIVHLAPIDGIGAPDVVQYLGKAGGKVSGRAVVMGADRVPFTVEESELSHIPIVREQTQRLGAEVQAWRIFALKVARLLASPGAEDMAALTTTDDLPELLECLQGTLRERGQAIRRLRTRVAELEAEVASLRALTDGALTAAEAMAATLRGGR